MAAAVADAEACISSISASDFSHLHCAGHLDWQLIAQARQWRGHMANHQHHDLFSPSVESHQLSKLRSD